jgi:MFS family permease
VPLTIFRNRNVSGANLAMAAVFAGNLGMFFLITLYLQLVEHYSPIGTGLVILPFPVILGLVAAQMRRLIARHGYRRYLILGPALVAAGMAWCCFLPVHGNYRVHLLPGLLVMPVGYGMSFPSAYAAATSGVPARQAGLASGLITTAQQIGGAVGLAVISAVAASYTASLTRDSLPQALTSGYDLAMAVAAGFTLLASVAAISVIRARRPAPAGPAGVGLLHGVLGLGQRRQQPVGEIDQPAPLAHDHAQSRIRAHGPIGSSFVPAPIIPTGQPPGM